MKFLYIEYADPHTQLDPVTVRFRILDHEVADQWVNAMHDAQQYQIDDPFRFYGLNEKETELQIVLEKLNHCVDIINSHSPIIERKLTDINDQDTLNYLHHIFEVYHGLLGKQTHRFYLTAPIPVRVALSDLNVLIHRCETAQRGHPPHHTVTYYKLPKNRFFKPEHYQLFTNQHEFGTVFLNYSEIGKTISNLMDDNDEYITPEAFQPYKRYGADFMVKYWTTNPLKIKERNAKITAYYESHKDSFGPWQDCFVDGSVPVAVIDQPLDLNDIAKRQYVKSVTIKENNA